MSKTIKNIFLCTLLSASLAPAAKANYGQNQQTFSFNDLVWACRDGNLTKVQGLLMAGMSPNAPYGSYEIPLIEAVRQGWSGNISIVSELLNYGADIDARDWRNDTALKWAAFNGQFHIASGLLDRGANIHIRDIDGYTALLDAVRKGHFLIVELLLKNGACPSDMDNLGRTAHMIAREHSFYDIIDLLHSYAPHSIPNCIPGISINVDTNILLMLCQ